MAGWDVHEGMGGRIFQGAMDAREWRLLDQPVVLALRKTSGCFYGKAYHELSENTQ